MKRIAAFCIPAHGHTNPMLPVVAELVKRGNEVRFYSFDEFAGKKRRRVPNLFPVTAILTSLRKKKKMVQDQIYQRIIGK